MRPPVPTIVLVASVALGLMSSRAAASEVCGDGLDNDSDLMTDEGCFSYEVTGTCDSPVGCASTGLAGPKAGGVVYRFPPDVQARAPYGPPLVFERVYMSQYEPGGSAPAYRTPLGPHWGHNYASWLEKNTAPNPDQVVLHAPSGRDILFQYASTASGTTTTRRSRGSTSSTCARRRRARTAGS
jgi:hypothetical protein